MPRVIYSPEAERDLSGIVEHIAEDNPAAARRWLQRMCEACEVLASQPEVGELRPDFGVAGCRSFSVGNHVIFFRSADGGIEVARVVQGRRDMTNF